MIYTTDNLIAGIKLRGKIPTANGSFQSTDFLSIADSEIRSNILPMILRARESYYSYDVSFSLTAAGVYAIPTRAVGAKLQGIYLLDSASGIRYPLNLIEEEEVVDPTVSPNGNPSFYIKANNVVLVPQLPESYDTLVLTIFTRISQLCQTSAAAQVVSISSNTVTVNAVPSTFSTSTPLDLIRGVPHYDFWALSQTPTGATGTMLTFSSVPTGLAAGDWIMLAEQSPVIQTPVEFYPMIEQRVANTYFRSQGFTQALEAGEKALEEMQDSFLLISPRSERTPKKIVNRSGLLNRSNYWP